MRPVFSTKTLVAADDDNICASQTPAAGALLLNGVAVTAGVAALGTQRRVLVTAVGDESTRTLTVTGTNEEGIVIRQTITGPNATTGATTLDFFTITGVTISGNAAGAIKVGTNGVGATKWVPLDQHVTPFHVSLQMLVGTGTANFTAQYTQDDVFAKGSESTVFKSTDTIAGGAVDVVGTLISPVGAVRMLINSGTDAVRFTIRQAGLGG